MLKTKNEFGWIMNILLRFMVQEACKKTLDFIIKFFLCCTIKLLQDYDVSWGRVFETTQGLKMASIYSAIYTEINSKMLEL